MSYLAREQSHAEVYVVDTNQKFWIPTPAALLGMGYNWTDVQVVADGSLAALPTVSADSISPTPPSLMYPPDGAGRHFPVDLPTAKHIVSAGKQVRLVELRGWLRTVDDACNGSDPDWNYHLEIDPEWSDSVGVDLHQVIRMGNILQQGMPANYGRKEAVISVPTINCELDAWPNKWHLDKQLPEDWTFTNANGCPNATDIGLPNIQVKWAFNPLHPSPISTDPNLPVSQTLDPLLGNNNPLDPLQSQGNLPAPYVRMTGSLVTDQPHDMKGGLWKELAIKFGWSDQDMSVMSELWDGRPAQDPMKITRWTEMHPVDGIWVLPPKTPKYSFRAVAVFARNGLLVGDRTTLDVDLFPPGNQPSGMQAAVQENVGPETNFSTIAEGNAVQSGANISKFSDRVHVHVAVQGQGGWGAPGKFTAFYRVYWEPIPPPKGKDKDSKEHKEKDGKDHKELREKLADTLSRSWVPGGILKGAKSSIDERELAALGDAFISPEERPLVGEDLLEQGCDESITDVNVNSDGNSSPCESELKPNPETLR
jgi:hypothetical protein